MLHIQDPYFSDSYTLHEAMIESCTKSIMGYGAYAFASRSGIEILLKDNVFDALLEKGSFSLLIGIDEITNLQSIETLNSIKELRPNLEIHAFYNNNRGSLFHPKLSYFKNKDKTGTLVLGSGNLTLGGLRKNREAFNVINLSIEEFQRVDTFWKNWLSESNNYIKDINDPSVIKKVKENQYIKQQKIILPEAKDKVETVTEMLSEHLNLHEDGWQFYSDSTVLIAEIPRSGDRWKQANFDINTFQNFFGATPGDNSQRILLRNINENNTLSSIEIRPSVSVASQNYRFELDAASGLSYPRKGKPIGIFIKLTTRMFLYHLYMPSHPLYSEINEWLNAKWNGRIDRMKRVQTDALNIIKIIEKSVFNHYLAKI